MNSNYLSINSLEFCRDVCVDGEIYNLTPSTISPSVEIIKTTERSLSGRMQVDLSAVKRTVNVVFDLLTNKAFNFIRNYLKLEDIDNIDADGLEIEYFDMIGTKSKVSINAFVDGFSFVPFIIEDEIMWREVSITFIEI